MYRLPDLPPPVLARTWPRRETAALGPGPRRALLPGPLAFLAVLLSWGRGHG